ncbi:hypothetical protein [Acetobacter persici]|uniref:hypothetical protein n=1 Tax=Acetobacter persici TaxID=1076596 RepID=UPI0039ED4496
MSTLLDFSAGVAVGGRGDTLSGAQLVDAATSGVPMLPKVSPGPTLPLQFSAYGDIGFRVIPDQTCSLSISGGVAGQIQRMRILIQQPPAGNCDITWPDDVIWPDGAAFVDSRIGSVCCVDIMWDGASRYYGSKVFG